MHFNLVYIIVSVIVAFWIQRKIQYRWRNLAGLPLPPGPYRLPLIGNVFNFPKAESWLAAAWWRKEYGDLVYLQVLGHNVIFANSYDTAMDLLDKRALIYSDRPPVPMLRELMDWDWLLTGMSYGPRLQQHRMILHQFVHRAAMKRHHSILTLKTHQLIANLLNSPDRFFDHVRNTTVAIVMMIAYGHEVSSQGDIYVKLADEAMRSLSIAAEPGAFLVNYLHPLKYVPAWFPGAGFKRKAKTWRKLSQAMLNDPYEMTKRKILDGTARSSMTSDLFEQYTKKDGRVDGEDLIAGCTAATYAGGSDTTVSAITSFLLALVLYPEVQTRGQEELDRVVGHDRLPTFDDRSALPYIEGIIKETLRWNPVIRSGAPHVLTKDDEYNGYFIPAGTAVFPNHWEMMHDETEYPDSFTFLPERWMPENGQKLPRDPTKVAFGFGRRLCPGKDLAEDSIYIAIVTILATLNVQMAKDARGQLITPSGNYRLSAISHPEPFECSITPRSPEVVAIVHHAIEIEQ